MSLDLGPSLEPVSIGGFSKFLPDFGDPFHLGQAFMLAIEPRGTEKVNDAPDPEQDRNRELIHLARGALVTEMIRGAIPVFKTLAVDVPHRFRPGLSRSEVPFFGVAS